MPLIVTTTVADETPTRVVSPDGTTSATADSDNGGVLVRADFSSSWGVSDTFEANVNGWTTIYDATATRTTSSPISGSGSLLWTRQQPTSSLSRAVAQVPTKPYEQKVVVYFSAKTTVAGDPVAVSVDWATHVEMGTVTNNVSTRYAIYYVPANTTMPLQVLFNATGPLASGNLIIDDLRIQIQPPTDVYFFRDGVPIRGASPAPASGGIAYAYDYEAPFGQSGTWTAQPVYTIRDTEAIAPSGDGASLVLPDLKADYSISLKSLNQPELSRKVLGKWPAATRTWDGRDTLSANPGAQFMSGSWDVPVAGVETWVMETTTHAEAKAMEDLLLSGPVMVQHAQVHQRADIYAVVKSVSVDAKRGPMYPERLWSVGFQPVEQPTPVGAPLLIPGRSFADFAATFDTYAQATSGLSSYDSYLSPVTVVVGTGYGIAPYGTTAYGV